MPLGMEVGLSPGHIVLDGEPTPPKMAQPPIFGPYLLWPNGWVDQDATWYHGGRPWPRGLCVRWVPIPSPEKGGRAAPNFRPMFIIVIVITLEHCTVVISLFKFKF